MSQSLIDLLQRVNDPKKIPTREDRIDEINATPHEDLRFRHFRNLKVGPKDRFSRLGLDRLLEGVSLTDRPAIEEAFPRDDDRASCFRWLNRGLEISRAIRKVKCDVEISVNAFVAKIDRQTRPQPYAEVDPEVELARVRWAEFGVAVLMSLDDRAARMSAEERLSCHRPRRPLGIGRARWGTGLPDRGLHHARDLLDWHVAAKTLTILPGER